MTLDTFTSYGRGAGSARVRVFDWIDRVAPDARAHDYLGGTNNSLGALLRRPGALLAAERELRRVAALPLGTALISRQASPFGNGAMERQLLRRAERGVYDFDDALAVAPDRLGGVVSRRTTWRRSVMSADIVIAGNATLAEHASQFSTEVVVIPSCVEPDDYTVKQDFAIGETPRALWLGSPSTEAYLGTIEDALLAVHGSHGLRLTVLSAGSTSLGALDAMVDRITWTPDSFGTHIARADIGIMPLVDDEWSRGKCAYKLLQYGAAALPSIGSPVGANREVLDGTGGLAASTPDEWIGALQQAVTASASERAALGDRARSFVDERFSFRAWEPAWRSALGLG